MHNYKFFDKVIIIYSVEHMRKNKMLIAYTNN